MQRSREVNQKPAPFRAPPFPFEPGTQSDFEHALQGAAQRTAASGETLRAAVLACVQHLKSIGMEPEGVLITMRAYLNHTVRMSFPGSGRDQSWAVAWLGEQVAKWSIESYFSAGSE